MNVVVLILVSPASVCRGQHNLPETPAEFKKALTAAETGNVEAMYTVARCYIDGAGVAVSDKLAVVWLEKAIDKGHGDACQALGKMYEDGRVGGKPDKVKAMQLYDLGIKRDSGHAMNAKGFMLILNNKPKDFPVAAKLFHDATKKKVPAAFTNLGKCYYEGIGVGQDKVEGMKLFAMATQLGCERGCCNLASILIEFGKFEQAEKLLEKVKDSKDSTIREIRWGLLQQIRK